MTHSDTRHAQSPIASDLPPAVEAIIGVDWLYWCLEEAMDDWHTSLGGLLTRAECKLLVALDRPKRMGLLAQELNILPSSVTALADSACGKGMTLRRRDPQDRRAWLLQVSDDGDAKRMEMLDHAAREFARLTGLNEPEVAALAKLVTKARLVIQSRDTSKGPPL